MADILSLWEYIEAYAVTMPESPEQWTILRQEYKRYRNRENKRRQRKKYTEVTVKLLPKERIEIDQRRKGPGLTRPSYIKYAALNRRTPVHDPVDLKQLNYLLMLLVKVLHPEGNEHKDVSTLIQQIQEYVSQGN